MNGPDKETDALMRLLPARQPFIIRYGATFAMVLLSFAVRFGMGDLAGPYGFILFAPALIISSLLFGRGAGLFAVASGALAVALYLDWTGQNAHPTALASFLIIGTGLVLLGDALHRALDGLNRARNENAMLLDEVSHRIKNKFATIVSVIGLQAKAAPPEARPSLDAVARRVHVLAALHTHLQASKHRGSVQMQAYLTDLCNALRDSAGHLRNIALAVNSAPLLLPPREATAVGLIVNELAMNCYKYAFPDERSGGISVRLECDVTSVVLSVTDDGIGCSSTASAGMGTGLVSLLAGQLDGTMERTEASNGGCAVCVSFPLTSAMRLGVPSGPKPERR